MVITDTVPVPAFKRLPKLRVLSVAPLFHMLGLQNGMNDEAIVHFLRKSYNILIGEPTAELVKMTIGSAYPEGEEQQMEVKGRDIVSGIPKTVRISSAEVREAIQEPIAAVVDAVRQALERTPPELASDIVDRGIVMTGGGALLRGLDSLLRENTNLPINVDEEPLTSVVRGTGRILDDPEKYRGVLTLSRHS